MNYFLKIFSKYFIFIFLLLTVYASVLTIFNGSENDSLLRVFSSDEVGQVIRLQKMLTSDSIDAGGFKDGFYHYGQAYSSVAFGIIKVLDYFGFDKYSFQVSVLVFKMLSITGYVFSIILFYLVLKSIGIDDFISSIFTLFFAVHSDYWGWATTIHPDTIQMCLFLLAMFLFLKIRNFEIALIITSFVIGVSFGTKYSGIFLTIFIASALILNTIYRAKVLNKNNSINYFFNITSWTVISFFFGWIFLNPYVLSRFNRLLVDLLQQSKSISSIGGGTILNDNWGEWFAMFHGEYGSIITITILVGLIYLFVESLRVSIVALRLKKLENLMSDRKQITLASLAILSLINIVFLLIVIRYREWRYAFHILPFIIILSAYGVNLLLKKYNYSLLNTCFFIGMIFFIFPKSVSNFELLANTHKIESENPYVVAGQWLKNNYDKDTRILSGVYSYVDKDYFDTVEYTHDVTAKTIRIFDPDLVFMNDSVPGRYVWKKSGTNFSDNDFVYAKGWKDQQLVNEFGELFKKMTSKKSNWLIVYESDSAVIFERKKESLYE